VESVESQKQASRTFHEPLGNLAKRRRDFHIPTARRSGLQKWKTKSRFPTFPAPLRDDNPGLPFPHSLAAFGRAGVASRRPTGEQEKMSLNCR
jgi:hypothetical protein